MAKQTIEDLKEEQLKGKTFLVRCDFNVPMQDGAIQDDTRVKAAIPTIQYLMEKGAKVVLCSHLGKPKPAEMTEEEMKAKYSLSPVAGKLSEELGKDVKFADDLTGDSAKAMISGLGEGDVGLLENTRFDPREEKNDDTLSLELSELADGYVNDAFGSAHRAHSSTAGVTTKMQEQGKETALGLLMQKEVEELGAVLNKPERPFVAILGGAKVSSKIGVIENLLPKVDKLVIGGKMATTFLKAKGYDVGASDYEDDKIDKAKEIMKKAFDEGKEIILPTDLHVAKIPEGEKLTPEIAEQAEDMVVNVEDGIPEGYQSLDVGEQTLDSYAEVLGSAKTIIFNGDLGYAEAAEFARGTEVVTRFIAKETNAKCVICGGDTVAAVNKVIVEDRNDEENAQHFDKMYLSTGGGASLEFLAGNDLPGIAVIQDKVPVKTVDANQGGAATKKAEITKSSLVKE